jgi:hypothetical protein
LFLAKDQLLAANRIMKKESRTTVPVDKEHGNESLPK